MTVAVVNSGGANIASVLHALGRLGAETLFTADAAEIRRAERVLLPGVGAAGHAMEMKVERDDPLTAGLDGEWFYFVHSFAAPTGDCTVATATHGEPFSAVVRRGNFCGAQFHPERSAAAGARLLRNFLEMPAS